MKRIYLALPYSGMRESSYEQATTAACLVLEMGCNVFSPITHGHAMAEIKDLPTDWDFWEEIDKQFIEWADEVWVLIPREGLEKVRDSRGVIAEIAYAKVLNRPVRFFHNEDDKLVEQDMFHNL